MSVNNIPSIIRLQTDNFTHNVWGGRWIPRLKKMPAGGQPVGESWEFSGHKDHPSRIKLLDGTETDLRKLIRSYPAQILGRKISKKSKATAPFLVKLIDANNNLSLQVHPSDAYAKKYERDSGKAESWIILESGKKKSDGFIYLGFKKSAKNLGEKFKEAIQKKRPQFILPFLNKIRVRPGQVFELKPGTIHAIGKGVRLFEIQQTSDLTYRVWDWNRPVRRPLHLSKAFDVLQFAQRKPESFRPRSRPVSSRLAGRVREENLLVNRAAGFEVNKFILEGRGNSIAKTQRDAFCVLTVLRGEVTVSATKDLKRAQEWRRVQAGQSVIIPAFVKKYEVRNESNRSLVFKSVVPA